MTTTGVISTMFVNSLQTAALWYADLLPVGTLRVQVDLLTPENTLFVMVTGVSFLHVNEVRLVQFEKASLLMLVTLLGIVTEVSPVQ